MHEVTAAGERVVFYPTPGANRVHGWYTPGELHVCVVGQVEAWLDIFIHEFQHFRQNRNAVYAYQATDDVRWLGLEGMSCNCLFEELYVDVKRRDPRPEIDETQRHEIVRRVIECERDCWLRTLREIDLYRLPLDRDAVARAAFEDIAAYAIAYWKGRWPGESRNGAVFPTDIMADFFDWAARPENQRMWTKK